MNRLFCRAYLIPTPSRKQTPTNNNTSLLPCIIAGQIVSDSQVVTFQSNEVDFGDRQDAAIEVS